MWTVDLEGTQTTQREKSFVPPLMLSFIDFDADKFDTKHLSIWRQVWLPWSVQQSVGFPVHTYS